MGYRPSAPGSPRRKLVRNHRGRNGQPLLNDQQQAWITSSTPRSQVSLQADWSYRRWGLTLRETRYSKTVSELDYYTGEHAYSTTVFNRFENSPKYITDVALRYAAPSSVASRLLLTDQVRCGVSARLGPA